MTREDVIKVFVKVNEMKPGYFKNVSKEKKLEKIESWYGILKEYSFNSVLSFVERFIQERNRVPDIDQILENAKQEQKIGVIEIIEKYRCPDGRIRYGSSLMKELSFDDWYKIPAEMMSIMEYDPSLNTKSEEAERQKLLKEALRLQALD